jgi:hypothetical protein
VRDGPALENRNNQTVNIRNREAVVVGYPSGSTVPFFLWGGSRDSGSPDSAWLQGQMPPGAVTNGIETLARLSASNVIGNIYDVVVEVRSPASIPLNPTNRPPVRFSTLVYSR